MEYYRIAGAAKRAADCFPEPYLRCAEPFLDYLTGIMLALLTESEREGLLEAHIDQLRNSGDAFCVSLSAADRVREGCEAAFQEGIEDAICRFSGKTVGDSTVYKAAEIIRSVGEESKQKHFA